MKRTCETFRFFVYICVCLLDAIFIVVTVFNLFLPIGFSISLENKMWLLLYLAEPILLFADIYLYNLAKDVEWWI